MSRLGYCRDQARLCRELALRLRNRDDVERLLHMAKSFDAEADTLERPQVQQQQQSQAKSKDS